MLSKLKEIITLKKFKKEPQYFIIAYRHDGELNEITKRHRLKLIHISKVNKNEMPYQMGRGLGSEHLWTFSYKEYRRTLMYGSYGLPILDYNDIPEQRYNGLDEDFIVCVDMARVDKKHHWLTKEALDMYENGITTWDRVSVRRDKKLKELGL
jgi:hypothetical protein